MNIDDLLKRREQLCNLSDKITSEVILTGDRIISKGKKNYPEFILCPADNSPKRRLSIKDHDLIKATAQQEYAVEMLSNIKNQLYHIDQLISSMETHSLERAYYDQCDTKRELIEPYIISNLEYAKKWQEEKYDRKPFAAGETIYHNLRGEEMRSKSECQISDLLFFLGIPYKYEYPTEIKGKGIWNPDFRMLNILTRIEVLMEHLGRMGDPAYVKKNLDKLIIYADNGYIEGQNLLITMETADRPLDLMAVEKMLRAHFPCKNLTKKDIDTLSIYNRNPDDD